MDENLKELIEIMNEKRERLDDERFAHIETMIMNRFNEAMAEIRAEKSSVEQRYQSLREIFEERNKLLDERVTSQKEAIVLQRLEQKEKNADQNEWRGEASDRQREYMPRKEVMVMFDNVTEKLDRLNETITQWVGRDQALERSVETNRNLTNDGRENEKNSREMVFAYFFGFTTLVSTVVAVAFAISKLTGH